MRNQIRKNAKEDILDTLIPKIRQRLLAKLLLQPEKHWYLTQLAAELKVTPSTLQRDLVRLSDVGILERAADGGRVYFRANRTCPIYQDLKSLFERTIDQGETLQKVLEPYQDKLLVGVLIMSQTDADHLIAIGRANFQQLTKDLSQKCGNRLDPNNIHCYWPEELSARLRSGQPLLTELLSRDKEFLIGSQQDLQNLIPTTT